MHASEQRMLGNPSPGEEVLLRFLNRPLHTQAYQGVVAWQRAITHGTVGARTASELHCTGLPRSGRGWFCKRFCGPRHLSQSVLGKSHVALSDLSRAKMEQSQHSVLARLFFLPCSPSLTW